ncbi:IS1 family transposase [Dongshaea marina]|uniref:IS1 family transposase n=1 Tax=Dongshaea marina TaxID=2047966 RepID=UPI00389967CD
MGDQILLKPKGSIDLGNNACRYCKQGEHVRRHGFGRGGHQRYYCTACRRTFQLNYHYRAHEPGMKEQIVEMALNGSGVRGTVRVLKVGINTVIRTFKKLNPIQLTQDLDTLEDAQLICELDEMWSYVGNKDEQVWLWLVVDSKRRKPIAHFFGPRTDASCRQLLEIIEPLHVAMFTSDDWGSYKRCIAPEQHLTGKIFTQRVERQNLTLRTRIKRLHRKTPCFSRSREIHEKVIGTFLEREFYNALEA